MPGTPVVSGAIAGTFLCGQMVAGQQSVSAPFAPPILELRSKTYQVFDTTPTVAEFGKPRLELVPRAFLVSTQSTQAVNKAILLLVPRAAEGQTMLFAQMGMPVLELHGRAFLPSSSTEASFGKPILELVSRQTLGRIAALIPSEEVDLILVPTVEEDGGLLLTPVAEEGLLLVPTNEAVG